MIRFLLNHTLVVEDELDPNLTVLNYLRQNKRRCGTKEGCASGDCGACTVTLGREENGKMVYETANSCLTLVSHLQGKQLITVEDLKQGGRLHSVQQAMVDCHASQCGFCTPGFVMSLFALQKNSNGWQHKQTELALAGNLCRCTGYRPIADAARQACNKPENDTFHQQSTATAKRLHALKTSEIQSLQVKGKTCFMPKTLAQLADLLAANPQAKLLAGGTDLALQITQLHKALPLLISIDHIDELKTYQFDQHEITLGAGMSLNRCYQFLADLIPEFSKILERFASLQIRYQGTLGGNIANASPIGDTPPMLLALNASVELQQGEARRRLPLNQFFLSYRKTALRAGEFIRAIVIPQITARQRFTAWKVSKRLEDDISAVFAAFLLEADDSGRICQARIAFGGLAEIPKRATYCEQSLIGLSMSPAVIEQACTALERDFQPLTDFRASADYRLQIAKNLLRRFYAWHSGEATVLEVSNYVA